jgi:hypothetical protein
VAGRNVTLALRPERIEFGTCAAGRAQRQAGASAMPGGRGSIRGRPTRKNDIALMVGRRIAEKGDMHAGMRIDVSVDSILVIFLVRSIFRPLAAMRR